MTSPDLLSVAEAAEMLGCSIRTIHRRIQRGDLPIAYQLPGPAGPYVLRREDVEHAAQQQLGHDRRQHLTVVV